MHFYNKSGIPTASPMENHFYIAEYFKDQLSFSAGDGNLAMRPNAGGRRTQTELVRLSGCRN